MNRPATLESSTKLAFQTPTTSSIGDPVREYSFNETPHVEWLTHLKPDEPRENLQPMPLSVRISKQLFDIVAASGMMIALSPLLVLAWCVVRISLSGTAIYSQT